MTGTTAEVYRSKLRRFCLSSTAKTIKSQTTISTATTAAAEQILTDRHFKKMLSDIDEGKIDLVIVKDLSRFGRNYVETGMYVQRFTERNIRFIAADDNYDSFTNGDDLLFLSKMW